MSEASRTRVGQRVGLWTLATLGVVVSAYVIGTLLWERRNCGAPDVTDCDMGPVLGGAPVAGLALLAMAVLIVSVELSRARRRKDPVG